MTWAVVKFTKEEAVEAVPLSWFISSSQECFWPPNNYKREKIFRLIEQKTSPLSDWKVYPAVILGSYDEFGLAQKKAKKAMVSTDLSSSNSDAVKGRGSRKRRKNFKYQSHTSSENSDVQDSSDDNIYPIYRKKTLGSSPICHENEEFRRSAVTSLIGTSRESPVGIKERSIVTSPMLKATEMQSISTLHERRQSTSITGESKESTPVILNTTEIEGGDLQTSTLSQQTRIFSGRKNTIVDSWHTPKASKCCNTLGNESITLEATNVKRGNVPHDDAFKKLVMDELSQINLKINTLIENVGTLIKTRRLEATVELHSLEHNIKMLYEKIPVKSGNELLDMEQWLDEDKNKRVMVSELARIGGNSIGQKVRKIMYRVVTDEVAVLFSWDGAKSKKAFKNLILARIILDAVKLQERECTENDIIDIIKYWLVKAKERMARKDKINP